MGYAGVTETDIPVELGASGPADAVARVAQDQHGKMEINVTHSPPWNPPAGGFDVRSKPGASPTLVIESAKHISVKTEWGPEVSSQDLDVVALTVTLGAATAADADDVEVSFYLCGLNFFTVNQAPISVAIAGRDWTFLLLDPMNVTSDRLHKEGPDLVTATLSTGPIKFGQVETLDQIVADVQALLSFARGGMIRLARRDVRKVDKTLLQTQLYPVSEVKPFSLGPIQIDGAHPGLMKLYLERCYGPFKAVAAEVPLQSLITLSILARTESTLEIKALIVANFLEVVRFQYAANVLVPANRAVRHRDDFLDPTTRQKLSFRELLLAFVGDKGLTGWSDDFKDLRNKIVHSAQIPGATFWDRYQKVMDALHFCDSIVLALVDWDRVPGDYIPSNHPHHPNPHVIGNNLKHFKR